MAQPKPLQVLYNTPHGLQAISFYELDIRNIITAANNIKADCFLMPDPEQMNAVKRAGLVTWGLFEVSKCDRFMQEHVLAVPTATWDLGDDAVGVLEMYMMHRLAAGG